MADARILVLARAFDRARSEGGLLEELRADPRFEVREVSAVDECVPVIAQRAADYSAVTLFVKFADLAAAAPLDWGAYAGLRVLYDHDAFWNYTAWGSLQGQWPAAKSRHGFDLLVCTGRRTADQMRDDGLTTEWVPKGYDPRIFFDRGSPARSGFCTYGTRYPARAAMVGIARDRGVRLAEIKVPYLQLNDQLNHFAACIVCNLDGVYRFGTYGRKAAKLQAGRFARHLLVRPLPGYEVMLKNYEASAAGCAVFCDRVPELEELGFVDGETTIVYENYDDLISRIEHYQSSPEALREIGARAAVLCAERHTWRQRVGELHDAIASHL
jgi:hypothetical protein